MKPHASLNSLSSLNSLCSLRGRHTHGEDGVGHRFGRGREIGGEPILQKPNAAGHGESHTHLRLGWVTRRRLQLFAYTALAVNQSQQLLLETDIRFRAHQHLEMIAIVGNVLADALNNMLDAGRIWLGE